MLRAAGEKTTPSRARLHAAGAMLLMPLLLVPVLIGLLQLTWYLLYALRWPSGPYCHPVIYLPLSILYLCYVVAAFAMAVIFIAGVIQLLTGKPIGLVASLYKKSKE